MTAKPHVATGVPYWIEILMAGDHYAATNICQTYCNQVGLCVTVERCQYVYTGSTETGVRVRLINYMRFPTAPLAIQARARDLAELLRVKLNQESYTLLGPDHNEWVSYREQP